jgi:hypothetical protein
MDCCGSCPSNEQAVLQLSCGSNDLKSVTTTGPCSMPEAGLSSYVGNGSVFVQSDGPGVCHIELTFATGFTYSADATFATHSGGVCGGPQCTCPPVIAPTQTTFMVNNPSTTCVDAGLDAAADAPTDAPSAITICPSTASQAVPCDQSGSCTGCRDNAGFECTCADAGVPGTDGGGPAWQCVDTGFACTEGTP